MLERRGLRLGILTRTTAQWHQWLRHTRFEAPTIPEQQYEVSRQAMMKQLAAQADERWKSVPSYLDPPRMQQSQPPTEMKDPGGYTGQTAPEESEGVTSGVEDPEKVRERPLRSNGCGRLAAEGSQAFCRTCTYTRAKTHGPHTSYHG